MDSVYLDNAATTKLDPQVAELMHRLMCNDYGNPSSIHSFGRKIKVKLEDVRTRIAELLHVQAAEIFFTSGGTEAINTIFHGAIHSLGVKRVISSKIEHPAILSTIEFYKENHDINIDFVAIDEQGAVDIKDLELLLNNDSEPTLVCLMHANNELGTMLPIEKVSELCQQYNAYLFSDTVQTMGKYENDFSLLKLDFAVSSSHKYHGPKGVGFMYINGKLKIDPLLLGGGQERNMRAGTENVFGILGMGEAFEIAYQEMEANRNYIQNLKEYLLSEIKVKTPQVTINGPESGLHTILNIGIPKNHQNDLILFNMDIAGVAVSGGSACSSGALQTSHVIEEIGLAKDISPIRVSFSKYNTKEDIDRFIDVLMAKIR